MRFFSIVLISLFGRNTYGGMELFNVTGEKPSKRNERMLVFTGSGIHKNGSPTTPKFRLTTPLGVATHSLRNVNLIYPSFKFVCGVAIPVTMEDTKRSLGAIFTLDGQFDVPTKPIYWWDKWNGRSLAEAKRQFNQDGTYVRDESRQFVYALIEMYLNRQGRNGRRCLLRAICENARVDKVEGIVDEIIFAVLRPSDDSTDEYRDAYTAGRYGAICFTMYPECPMGQGLFDGLSVTRDSRYFKD